MKYLVVVLVVFSLVINVSATDWYVSVNGDDDNNGTSTGNAWRTITHAVSEVSGTAGNPAVIHVGSGTFDRDNDEDFPIEIDSDQGYITIVGEGTDDTHIDASGGDDEDDYYVFEIDGAGEFILRYLHLEGGRGIVKVDDSDNGAIFENMSADEFVRNEDNSGVSAFQFNNVSGDVEFNNVEISGALDSRNGGAIRAESFQGDISIENSTFTECVAQWNNGGTIYIDDMEGDFSISGGTIVDSYTNDQGGAIFVEQLDGSFSVDDVTFTRPKARYNHGGAIYMNDLSGNFSVTNSSFVNSESDDKGGVIYANEIGGSFTLTNLDFTESIARYEEGGDIYLENCDGEVNIDGIDSDSPFGYSHGGSFFFEDIRDDITISNVTVWDAGDPICDGDDDDDDGEDDDGDDDDDDEDEDGGACTSDGFGGVFYFNHIGNANNSVTVEISNVEIGNCITAQSGGAFYFKDMGTSNNNGASIILSDIEVEGSTSRWEDGGAVYIENVEGPVTINNGVFTECFAQESGGAIYIRNVDELITLSGITISEGFSEYEYGGGIAILDAIGGMAFEDVVVSESRAFDHGGGIYINDFSESLSFDGVCVESSHSIWGAGGGIYIYVNSNHVDSLTIDHLALSENYVDDNHGGGMYIHSNQINVDTRISNFSVVENSSGTYGHGGGIYFYKVDNLFLTDGTLTGNTTGDPDAWSYKNGGGIYMYKINEVTMNNVVFWENEVQGDGGGLWARDIYNSFRLYDVIFYGNTAFRENNSNAGQGGGMYFERANADGGPDYIIQNALFAENNAERKGGAVYMMKGDIDFVNVTMAYNEADQDKHSIYCTNHSNAVKAYNCIIWGNGPDHNGNSETYHSNRIDFYYSNVESDDGDIVDGPGNVNTNPLYINPGEYLFFVMPGSRTIDSAMPDDPEADDYVEEYADFTHEPTPNGGQINMGFWGPGDGASAGFEQCGLDGNWPGGGLGIGGGGGNGNSESRKLVLRDKYIFMGTPVLPYDEEQQTNPDSALGDDVNNTDPSQEEQTWRISRWTNGTEYENGTYVGYLRYRENEELNGQDIGDVGDPPEISPGLGFWFVWNYGAVPDVEIIDIDISKYALEAEPYVLELEPAIDEDTFGWNMMANPWPFAMNWQDVEFSLDQDEWLSLAEASNDDNGWVNQYAYTWDHPNLYYQPRTGFLDVWEGFWVIVMTTDPIWLRFSPIIADPDEVPALELDELDEVLDWSLMLTARRTDTLQVDYFNWIGVGEEVNDGLDQYDAFEMAPQAKEAIFLRTRLLTENNQFSFERLTFDFRENNLGNEDFKAWMTEIWFYHDPSVPNAGDAYPVDVKLQWPTVNSIPEDVTLRLYEFTGLPFVPDPENLIVEDLRDTNSVIFDVNSPYSNSYMYARFWIVATEAPGILDAPEQDVDLPLETRLSSISPNPFNNMTTVSFDIAKTTNLDLRVFNLLGREVANVASGKYEPGRYKISWNATDMASGIYFVQMVAHDAGYKQVKKIILQK